MYVIICIIFYIWCIILYIIIVLNNGDRSSIHLIFLTWKVWSGLKPSQCPSAQPLCHSAPIVESGLPLRPATRKCASNIHPKSVWARFFHVFSGWWGQADQISRQCSQMKWHLRHWDSLASVIFARSLFGQPTARRLDLSQLRQLLTAEFRISGIAASDVWNFLVPLHYDWRWFKYLHSPLQYSCSCVVFDK